MKFSSCVYLLLYLRYFMNCLKNSAPTWHLCVQVCLVLQNNGRDWAFYKVLEALLLRQVYQQLVSVPAINSRNRHRVHDVIKSESFSSQIMREAAAHAVNIPPRTNSLLEHWLVDNRSSQRTTAVLNMIFWSITSKGLPGFFSVW